MQLFTNAQQQKYKPRTIYELFMLLEISNLLYTYTNKDECIVITFHGGRECCEVIHKHTDLTVVIHDIFTYINNIIEDDAFNIDSYIDIVNKGR